MPHVDEPRRPATLVTVIALTALSGMANLLVGGTALALILFGVLPNTPRLSQGTLVSMGVGYLVLGALTVAGGLGLRRGRAGSREFVTVLMLLRIAVAMISIGVVGTWYAAGSVVGIGVALLVVVLLWDSRANEYFLTAP